MIFHSSYEMPPGGSVQNPLYNELFLSLDSEDRD